MNAPQASRRRDVPPQPQPFPPNRLATFVAEHRAGLGAIAVVAAAAGLGWATWSRLGDRVRAGEDLVLRPEAIVLEGTAPWVRADLKLEALRNASLADGLPLDDPELVRRLARAFDMHPWVRQVQEVQVRHPAAATVRVRCREPVAMVAVRGGLLAVDAEAVVLPSEDFTAELAAEYPKVTGVESSPAGPQGFPWGDPLVEQGAAIAAAIGPDWKPLGLNECRPARSKRGVVEGWEVVGSEGRLIRFGSAPGHEKPGEPTAAIKIARLRRLAADPTAKNLDLTVEPAAQEAPRSIPVGR